MKFFASILLTLLMGSSLFYYGYFDVMLLLSKKKAMHSISAAEYNHKLRLFKVPANQQDMYGDDEVRIDGELYDVGEREIINDTLYLSLYHDTDEENVLSAISDFFKTDDAIFISTFPGNPVLKSVKIIHNPVYDFDALKFFFRINENNQRSFFEMASDMPLPFFDIITPPPRLS